MEIRMDGAFVWMGNRQMGADDVATHEGIIDAVYR